MDLVTLMDKLPGSYKIYAGPGKSYQIRKKGLKVIQVMTALDLFELLNRMIPK